MGKSPFSHKALLSWHLNMHCFILSDNKQPHWIFSSFSWWQWFLLLKDFTSPFSPEDETYCLLLVTPKSCSEPFFSRNQATTSCLIPDSKIFLVLLMCILAVQPPGDPCDSLQFLWSRCFLCIVSTIFLYLFSDHWGNCWRPSSL